MVADQAALALEGARAFDDFGRRLLKAVAAAAHDDGQPELADVLRGRPPSSGRRTADLLELAALFGELGRLDVEQRRLATRVVREFVDAAQQRHDGARSHTPRR